jgi:hypothetical protein
LSSTQVLVEEVYRRAGVNFERILGALEIDTGGPVVPPVRER